MTRLLPLLLALSLPPGVFAQTPEAAGAIVFPGQPPGPVPPPGPSAVAKLPADVLYVVTADAPFILLASPAGFVSVTYETGPIRVRGKFFDGAGRTESRDFKSKQVTIVEAVGSGRVELLAVPVGVAREADVVRRTLDADAQNPNPPPQPPQPQPPPPQPPADSFQEALQAAYLAEAAADRAAQVKTLANFYRASATLTVRNPGLLTLGDLQATMKSAVKLIGLPAGALAKVVPVVAQDEAKALGANYSLALSPAVRDAAAVEFLRVAAALEALK